MAERLSLRLGPSRLLAALLAGVHVVAIGALWLAPVPTGYALGCSVALTVHLVWVVRRYALRTDARAAIELEVTEDGSVSVRTRGGLRGAYRIGGSSFVSPALTVLNLRPEVGRRTRHVLVVADSVDADSFRRLRVWLRWRWREGERNGDPAGPAAALRR